MQRQNSPLEYAGRSRIAADELPREARLRVSPDRRQVSVRRNGHAPSRLRSFSTTARRNRRPTVPVESHASQSIERGIRVQQSSRLSFDSRLEFLFIIFNTIRL